MDFSVHNTAEEEAEKKSEEEFFTHNLSFLILSDAFVFTTIVSATKLVEILPCETFRLHTRHSSHSNLIHSQ